LPAAFLGRRCSASTSSMLAATCHNAAAPAAQTDTSKRESRAELPVGRTGGHDTSRRPLVNLLTARLSSW
jgi:hypothetical protein